MKLYIKNRLISLKNGSTVKDEAGNDVFHVKGKMMSIRKKKRVTDTAGNVIFRVQNKFFNWFVPSAFILTPDGERIAHVKKKIFTLKPTFFVEGYKDEFAINGSILGFNYEVLKNGQQIGHVHRDFNLLRDTFVLDCWEESEAAFLVSLVIAIDNIFDKINGSNE